jgi:hypothetical protein
VVDGVYGGMLVISVQDEQRESETESRISVNLHSLWIENLGYFTPSLGPSLVVDIELPESSISRYNSILFKV